MSELESQVVDAWRKAAADLGIRFTAPFVTAVEGSRVQFLGLVHSFGRPIGTVISVIGEPSEGRGHPQDDQYFRSILSGDSYQVYDRQLFIDTLDDWQFFGPNQERPPWYSGKIWGQ
jgi:hypothetical protein